MGFWSRNAEKIVDWWIRVKSPWFMMFKAGCGLMLVFVAGGATVSLASYHFTGSIAFGSTPAIIVYVGFFLGVLLTIVGAVGMAIERIKENNDNSKKRIIVVQQHGLSGVNSVSLSSALSKKYKGRKEEITVDTTRHVCDGMVADPTSALKQIVEIPSDIEKRANGANTSDVTLVYGGMMSVPYAFLTGFLIDNKGQVDVYDWNRNDSKWSALDGADDHDRFVVSGLDDIAEGTEQVIVAVSGSYSVNVDSVRDILPKPPMIELSLTNQNFNNHWSNEKQQALAKEFGDTMNLLERKKVQDVHLFIAAQNSVVFNLGRQYDMRNYPRVQVYQYERSQNPQYPWSVQMPTQGVDAHIVAVS